jgi:hypothetical protein
MNLADQAIAHKHAVRLLASTCIMEMIGATARYKLWLPSRSTGPIGLGSREIYLLWTSGLILPRYLGVQTVEKALGRS